MSVTLLYLKRELIYMQVYKHLNYIKQGRSTPYFLWTYLALVLFRLKFSFPSLFFLDASYPPLLPSIALAMPSPLV